MYTDNKDLCICIHIYIYIYIYRERERERETEREGGREREDLVASLHVRFVDDLCDRRCGPDAAQILQAGGKSCQSRRMSIMYTNRQLYRILILKTLRLL